MMRSGDARLGQRRTRMVLSSILALATSRGAPAPDAFAWRLGRYDAAHVTRWTVRDVRALGVGLAYLLPSFVLFAVFVFIPLGRTFYLSFYNTRATGAITTFAGLDSTSSSSPPRRSGPASLRRSSSPSIRCRSGSPSASSSRRC